MFAYTSNSLNNLHCLLFVPYIEEEKGEIAKLSQQLKDLTVKYDAKSGEKKILQITNQSLRNLEKFHKLGKRVGAPIIKSKSQIITTNSLEIKINVCSRVNGCFIKRTVFIKQTNSVNLIHC